jgi:hypothetical protein
MLIYDQISQYTDDLRTSNSFWMRFTSIQDKKSVTGVIRITSHLIFIKCMHFYLVLLHVPPISSLILPS